MSRTVAQDRLVAWMRRHQHTQVSAAVQLDTDQSTVSRWISGKARPGFERMLDIAKRSNGYVQLHDWAEPALASTAEPECVEP